MINLLRSSWTLGFLYMLYLLCPVIVGVKGVHWNGIMLIGYKLSPMLFVENYWEYLKAVLLASSDLFLLLAIFTPFKWIKLFLCFCACLSQVFWLSSFEGNLLFGLLVWLLIIVLMLTGTLYNNKVPVKTD